MTATTLPKTTSSYKLVPAGQHYTGRKNGPALGIVLHVTAGLQDTGMTGTDESMEGTIKWALGRRPEVSWHAGTDSDGVELCLPDWYTAWHAKGYNSRTIGIEISNLDARWDNKPKAWIDATLRNTARVAAAYCKKYGFPLTLSTKSQVDAAQAAGRKFGFTYHSYTSPTTRRDPGATFPWARFIGMVREEMNVASPAPAPEPNPEPNAPAPKNVLVVDGNWGPKTTTQFQKVMKAMGYPIIVDGKVDPDDSLLVRAAQRRMRSKGVKDAEGVLIAVDGRGLYPNSDGRYPKTGSRDSIEGLCKYLGIRVKGHFAASDEWTIKNLQKRLNTGTF